jgi:3-hydroxyacyl-CoA dehydrogenase
VLDLIGAAGVDRCIDLRSCDPSNHLPVILAKLYERGWNGCAVRQGWYKYTSGDERTPIPSEEVDKFVEEYRTNQVHICNQLESDFNQIKSYSFL